MAQSCDRIVDGLRQAGVSIDIIHFTSDTTKPRQQKQQNGSYTSIPFVNSEAHVLNLAWNTIKKLPPTDLLVCFGGYLSMTGAPIYSQWLSVPLATMIRGNDLDNGIFTPRKRDILRDALLQSKTICTVSSDKAWKIEQWTKHGNVHYVANGIDMQKWQPAVSEVTFATAWKQKYANNKLVLGLFGQLKAKKGVDFFLHSLRKTSHTKDTHLLLVGELDEQIETLLEETGCTYTLMPFHDRYELLKYYLCCDAIVIPSYYDGMPNVLLEAGALAIPVLASQVDGMADVITSGENGLLFFAGDDDSCRQAIYKLFDNTAEQRKALGQRLQSTIANQYTLNHEINAYQKLLF